MSIWLFSGINGSGKTLSAIRTVLTDPKFAIQDDKGKEVAKRPVYYYGIQDCALPWTELDADGVKNWRDLPSGSVVFVDECWRVFPSRSSSQQPPPFVSELAEHRKLGLDFVLISQRGIGQVDSFIRGLVERHFHLERLYGSNTVRCLAWEKCCDNVNDYHARKEASHSTWKLDSKYFSAYKSAELHTIKKRLPWFKLGLVGLLPVLLGLFGWVAYSTISQFGDSGVMDSLSVDDSAAFSDDVFPAGAALDTWASDRVPRVDHMPWTAPVYDRVTEPQSAPLPVGCILAEASGRCMCGTWQGTQVDVGPQLCRQIALHGYFDDTRERPEPPRHRGTVALAELPPVERTGGAWFIEEGSSVSRGVDDVGEPSLTYSGPRGALSFGASGSASGGSPGGGGSTLGSFRR